MSGLIKPAKPALILPQRAHLAVQAETRYRVVCRDARGNIRWRARAKNLVVTAGLNSLLNARFGAGLASPANYIGMVGPSITDGVSASIANGIVTSASAPWLAGDAGSPIILRGDGASGNDLNTTILSFQNTGQVTLAVNNGAVLTGMRVTWGPRAADTMASHVPWSEATAISNATRPAFMPNGAAAGGSMSNSSAPAVFTVNVDNTYVAGMFMADNSAVGGATGTLYGMAVWSSGGFRQCYANDTVTVTTTLTITSTQ